MRWIKFAGPGASGLVVVATVAVAMGPVAQSGELKRIQGDNEKAMAPLRQRQERAVGDRERDAAQAAVWEEVRSSARRALAWAEAHPDAPDSLDAIIWTVHGLANGYYPELAAERARAYDLLTERGLASEKVAPVCYYGGGDSIACPEARRFLETALSQSPSRLVRGAACLGLARRNHTLARIAQRARDPLTPRSTLDRWAKYPGDFLKACETSDVEALDREAELYFERLIAEFADVKMPHPYNPMPFGELARGELYAVRNLAVGKVAPEIVGEGVDGKPLKLSDHRGEVVAVVFWATWCGPCMGMVPHERELTKRLAGKPFTILGVNGDDDRTKAKEAMAREGMTWPSWWNGGQDGGIVAAWGVRAWPSVYVLDARGVIRYEGVRGEMLDKAVDLLVAEMEPASK
ncbi:MAG TPA: redoxin family protein [Isosphaeraceae bacterium]